MTLKWAMEDTREGLTECCWLETCDSLKKNMALGRPKYGIRKAILRRKMKPTQANNYAGFVLEPRISSPECSQKGPVVEECNGIWREMATSALNFKEVFHDGSNLHVPSVKHILPWVTGKLMSEWIISLKVVIMKAMPLMF